MMPGSDFVGTTNYVKFAREVAHSTWDYEKRKTCLDASDVLQDAVKAFERSWSLNDMRTMVGAFTKCVYAVERISPGGGTGPIGGRLRAPLEKVA